jgi:vesicle coat complex subunit
LLSNTDIKHPFVVKKFGSLNFFNRLVYFNILKYFLDKSDVMFNFILLRCVYALLNSSSSAVKYEAAGTLITLSSAPSAVKAAASCYIDLIIKESDNNVKLIVLDKIIALKEVPSHEKVLQELVMDILRVLASPDFEVRRKTLNLALDLVTSRTISIKKFNMR